MTDDSDDVEAAGHTNVSPMPTIYSLPTPKRGKYSYSHGSDLSNTPNRILGISQDEEDNN
jgi:hypothetical protein